MNYSEEELISAIKRGGRELNEVMTFLYERSAYRESLLDWLRSKGASASDAEDIFQDGLRHLIMNIRNAKFRGDSSVKTYLTRICSNLWFTQFSRQKHLEDIKESLTDASPLEASPEELFFYQERTKIMADMLSQLGGKCKRILGLWSLGYSMKEIRTEVGYKTDGVTRKKKHQCFQKLMLHLKERPELVKVLMEMYR